jgi:CO/xanthine dehydrogenase Mo-binding subunit
VVVDGMGGGFGSKSQLGAYGRIAVALSRAAQAPVRLILDREEEQMDSGNRPGTWQHLRIGARRDGSLTAISLQSYGTAGVGLGAGVGNVAQALSACPNVETAQYDVFTNAGPGCAMRGPGNTPGAFGLEQAIDELAERLAIDPLILRDRIDPSPVRREERRIGAERIGWPRRQAPGKDSGPLKRGLGVAQSLWGANVQTNASCGPAASAAAFVRFALGGVRGQSPEWRPHGSLLAACDGDGHLCHDGRWRLALRAERLGPTARLITSSFGSDKMRRSVTVEQHDNAPPGRPAAAFSFAPAS